MKELSKQRAIAMLAAMIFALIGIAATGSFSLAGALDRDQDDDRDGVQSLRGRVVAVGIPGASTVSAVGVFLPGGPIHDKPALAAFTQPGQVLDPVRILVGSTSNFGAPRARADELAGSFLSIDPRGATLVIPPDFAAGGGQASALGGRVQVFTANNAAFLNSIKNPGARTANFTGTSNPLGLSINWAFGRLWPANAPTGLTGPGTSTILDPQGWGLAGPPNPNIGGVYFDNLTNRGMFPPSTSEVIPGRLSTGAVGTAFLGASPDGTAKAVFAVVEADGGIVQEHTLQGLDGLAPRGTIAPLVGRDRDDEGEEDDDRGVTPRVGAVLNWFPTMVLYVSEPFENSIKVLNIIPDHASPSAVFRVTGIHQIRSEAFDEPIDLAPVIPETDDNNFSSNTSLNEDSDIYVANRGNNTIVRVKQDGTIVAIRKVRLANGRSLGSARLNGIAVAHSAEEEQAPPTKMWVTVTGRIPGVEHSTGAVIELPTF